MKNRKTVLATVLALVLAFHIRVVLFLVRREQKGLYRRHLPAGNA